jgi:hypothetical protein
MQKILKGYGWNVSDIRKCDLFDVLSSGLHLVGKKQIADHFAKELNKKGWRVDLELRNRDVRTEIYEAFLDGARLLDPSIVKAI